MRFDLEQFLTLTVALGTAGAIGAAVYTTMEPGSEAATEAAVEADAEPEPFPEAEPLPPKAPEPAAPAPAPTPDPTPAPALDGSGDSLDVAPGPQVEAW